MDFSKLKRNDNIMINKEPYIVVNNVASQYFQDSGRLEMVLELLKIGEPYMEPRYFLYYMKDKPEQPVRFEEFDPKTKKRVRIGIVSLSR